MLERARDLWRRWMGLQPNERSLLALFAAVVLIVVVLVSQQAQRASYPHATPPASVAAEYPTRSITGSSKSYERQEEVSGMAQAARDAGYDDATARQIGQEAAALCNGNPECLK